MYTVNEGSTLVMNIVFYDQLDQLTVPLSANYRVDDVRTGQNLVPAQTLPGPFGATMDLEIKSTENVSLSNREGEERRLTLEFTYGSTDDIRKGTAEYVFTVKNLKFYPVTMS